MYNYHANIIWAVNGVLFGLLILTSVVILSCVAFRDHLWLRRRRVLLGIKKNVYEMVLADNKASDAVCQPFIANITPQQFIDIVTNRRIDAAFFNESEQQFFRSCFTGPQEIAKLEKTAVRSFNKWRRIEAILSLGYTQAQSAVDVIKLFLLNKDRDIAYFAMISLGQIKTVSSARAFLGLLKEDPSNGFKVTSILVNFPEEISEDVIKLTEYHDPMVRYWAVVLLSKLAPPRYINKIEKLTHDQSPEVRSAACDCLGSISKKEAAPALLKCLKDDSWLVRSHTVLALSKIMGDEAMPEIVRLLNDGSWLVVEAVKETMVNHIEASLPYIETFLNGKDEIAKKYSVFALQDSGYLTRLLNDAVSGTNKDFAIRLLTGVVKSRIRTGLGAALSSLEPAIRAEALEILAKIGQE